MTVSMTVTDSWSLHLRSQLLEVSCCRSTQTQRASNYKRVDVGCVVELGENIMKCRNGGGVVLCFESRASAEPLETAFCQVIHVDDHVDDL